MAQIDFKEIEKEILKFWKNNRIYEKSKEKNKDGKKFYFLQGPPYTSGRIHIGHAWNNSLKDMAMRFFRLNGFDVWDRGGYDMHGLPTANKVQEKLKLKHKEDIIKFGLDKFIKECKKFSIDNAEQMNKDLERLGIWMDLNNSYLPVENEFISGEWLLIKKAHEQNRLYKGKKIMHWCGNCETSLAKHELEYENVKDTSIFLKFKLKNKKNEYLIIWTTTPWTIPFNLAVMANPEIEYVKEEVDVEGKKEKWIMAKPLVNVFINSLLGYKHKTLETFKGKDISGLEYEHPFYNKLKIFYDNLKKDFPKVHTVLLSEKYVDATSGSGLVHCAPGCGPEDYEVGKENGIEAFNTLNEQGAIENLGEFSGLIAKKDDKKFIDKLKETGNLITTSPVEHEYAHCWRCHKPVVFRTTEQWFLKIEDLVKKILDYDKKIKWVPESAKNSYESWISNIKDNGITRQRYWGCPAPIWECENLKCKNIEVIGNQKELKEKALTKIPKDLHKPYIDKVKLKCSKCGKSMSRISDVLDVWIDSGTVSWNCLYYPERQDYFKKYFPADLILEATEQTRLWYSMLQLCSTIVFGKQSYTGAYNHGMIFDFQGMKMSKSIGNIISPYKVIDEYSSEIFRYYVSEITAGVNINFNWEDVKQKQRNLLVLMNTGNYLIQLNNQINKKQEIKKDLEEKYILSRLNSTIKNTTELFKSYNLDKTVTEMEKFFLDLSRVYIKLTRDKSNESPEIVFQTLKESYIQILQMFSTVCPLLTESIWQNLRKENIVKEESIHLTNWPKPNTKLIDEKLEKEFNLVLEIIEKGLAERDKQQIGLKWPLASAEFSCNSSLSKELQEIIKNQLNIKQLNIKPGKEISVSLNTKLTPELEAEGYAREMSRKIQAFRKKLGLEKNQQVSTKIIIEEKFKEILEQNLEFLKERTNSKNIEIVTTSKETFKNISDFKIKNKRGQIAIII